MTTSRPDFIRHWRDIQDADDAHYPGSDELLSIGSPLGAATGMTRMGIHHELLPPGRRTSWPHAEADEEEFVYVIEGRPVVWIDGELFQLEAGDFVGLPAGTGIAHTFINNTGEEVRLLVGGEKSKAGNRIAYPLHSERNAEIGDLFWEDCPGQLAGPHDGLPDALRGS
ncbi:MAG: cupin domain-containing protein [Gammaproteobacteria bacterium]|nr:MAG: cupin domain-containing protein [Gammaproteobacteria bacterium]